MTGGTRLGKVWARIRLLLAVLLFAWSLLVVLPAPKMWLFYLSLGATEYGHWLALPALALVFAGSLRRVSAVLALAAALLFFSTAVRASLLARSLHGTLPATGISLDGPFSWRRLWMTTSPARGFGSVTYFDRDGVSLRLDLYRARSNSPEPCVIVIPGGGWTRADRAEFSALNHYLAWKGFAVAAIDYRTAPGAHWPAQREDVLAALNFLRTHASEFGIDPTRFALLGRSAGGQIAEAVAYSANDPSIRACVALYAPADLNFAFEYADPNDILNSLQLLKDYMGGTPAEVRANYDSASSILHVSKASVPTLLLHGRRDPLVWHRQSERLAARLKEVAAPHLFVDLPWATHAFDYNINGPGGQIAAWSIVQFLDVVTHGNPPAR